MCTAIRRWRFLRRFKIEGCNGADRDLSAEPVERADVYRQKIVSGCWSLKSGCRHPFLCAEWLKFCRIGCWKAGFITQHPVFLKFLGADSYLAVSGTQNTEKSSLCARISCASIHMTQSTAVKKIVYKLGFVCFNDNTIFKKEVHHYLRTNAFRTGT